MASVRDAMALLDVSRPTIMSWIRDGKFPNATKDDGPTGDWNIPRRDIEVIRADIIADLRTQIQHLEVLAQSGKQ